MEARKNNSCERLSDGSDFFPLIKMFFKKSLKLIFIWCEGEWLSFTFTKTVFVSQQPGSLFPLQNLDNAFE